MCTCERITFRCICRHKERRIERCWSYQFKKNNLCFAAIMPMCKSHKRHVQLDRLCDLCQEYFTTRYRNKNVAKTVVAKFLEYKESKGWGKKAIDPHTVPREVYITAADLDALNRMYPQSQPQPRPQKGVPAQVRAPPQVYRAQLREQTIPKSNGYFVSGGRSPARRHPPPPPPPPPPAAVVEHGTGEPIELEDLVTSDTEANEPYYHHHHHHAQAALPQLQHLAADKYREPPRDSASPQSAFLKHPKPHLNLRSQKPAPARPQRTGDSQGLMTPSDITVVKNLTARAQAWTYPNPETPQYPDVPHIVSAPRTPSWRVAQLLEEKRRQEQTQVPSQAPPVPARSEVDLGLNTDKSLPPSPALTVSTNTATYHVYTSPPSRAGPALARVLSPSHTHVPVPPPQRLEGVLVQKPSLSINTNLAPSLLHPSTTPFTNPPTTPYLLRPCTTTPTSARTAPLGRPGEGELRFYQERGITPRLCRSAPPDMVSVHVPPPNFTCAVQAECYCGGDKDTDKGKGKGKGKGKELCPACGERERLARGMKTDWI
ncbi:hypothetical protein F4810DRAFT_676083 [Camillea tinctor]|nr:hypothetical protein F4810DRAFT_676083 [Camillea tinctor]